MPTENLILKRLHSVTDADVDAAGEAVSQFHTETTAIYEPTKKIVVKFLDRKYKVTHVDVTFTNGNDPTVMTSKPVAIAFGVEVVGENEVPGRYRTERPLWGVVDDLCSEAELDLISRS
jgi:hypothetical protein